MSEGSVTERARQQAHRLKELRELTGLSKAQLAARLGFGTSQTYDLYERGVSVIRLDRLADWAAAFGLTTAEFSRRLGLVTAEPAGLRAELDALFPEDGATVEAALRDLSHRSPRQRGEALARIRALIRSDSE